MSTHSYLVLVVLFQYLSFSWKFHGEDVAMGNMMGAGETPKIPLQGGLCI